MRILKFLEFIASAMVIGAVVMWLAMTAAHQVAATAGKSRPAVVTELDKRIYRECRQKGITDFPSIQLAIWEAKARGEQ